MDMQGQRVLQVTQAQAWDALNDPEILKACITGCDTFELTQAHEYKVGVAIKIGPVSAKFTGKVTLSDIQAPDSYTLNFEAQGGVAGFGKGQSHVSLRPHAEGCELLYSVHSTVGGKLAQLGQRLIDGAAKSLAEDFFKRFEASLQAQYPPSTVIDGSPQENPKPSSFAVPRWLWLAVLLGGVAAWSFVR